MLIWITKVGFERDTCGFKQRTSSNHEFYSICYVRIIIWVLHLYIYHIYIIYIYSLLWITYGDLQLTVWSSEMQKCSPRSSGIVSRKLAAPGILHISRKRYFQWCLTGLTTKMLHLEHGASRDRWRIGVQIDLMGHEKSLISHWCCNEHLYPNDGTWDMIHVIPTLCIIPFGIQLWYMLV